MDWSWADTFNVAITGIVVVFIALVVLILIVWIVGKIFESIDTSSGSMLRMCSSFFTISYFWRYSLKYV